MCCNKGKHHDRDAPRQNQDMGFGYRPHCLLDFFPKDKLVFIDESHVSVSQIGGMYHGDRARKERLVEFGFRLPSALENRPLRPEEFDVIVDQAVYVSATPAPHEYKVSSVIAEQVIRRRACSTRSWKCGRSLAKSKISSARPKPLLPAASVPSSRR